MLSKILSILAVCAFLCCPLMSVNAQVRVRKSASDFTSNPSLVFKGIKNSLGLSAAMNSMLKACGWFELSTSAPADYSLLGDYDGSRLSLEISQNSVTVSRFSINTAGVNDREVAKAAVDALLGKLFKIKGICRTRIAFCLDNGTKRRNIYACDIDGAGLQRITAYQGVCIEPEWMPDGKSLLYTRYNRASTYVIQTIPALRKSRIVSAYKGMNLGASPSPDGKFLALVLSRDGQVDLYLKSLTTRARRRLTSDQAPEASPCWNPSGNAVCYTSGRNGRPQLYVLPVSGGTPRHLSTSGSEAVNPDWSQDNQIVYSARLGSYYTIATLDLDGKKPGKIVINAAGDWESPSWAPDNRHIVCYRTYQGSSGIYRVDTWTGKATPLVRLRHNASMPCWSDILE